MCRGLCEVPSKRTNMSVRIFVLLSLNISFPQRTTNWTTQRFNPSKEQSHVPSTPKQKLRNRNVRPQPPHLNGSRTAPQLVPTSAAVMIIAKLQKWKKKKETTPKEANLFNKKIHLGYAQGPRKGRACCCSALRAGSDVSAWSVVRRARFSIPGPDRRSLNRSTDTPTLLRSDFGRFYRYRGGMRIFTRPVVDYRGRICSF